MADQRGVKPELYHYIATGQDTNNTITNIINEIKEKNWYSVNLLGFSDARVVGMNIQMVKMILYIQLEIV